MDNFTVKMKVYGLLVIGQREFYVLGWNKVTNEQGRGMEGIGWQVTSTTPLNHELMIEPEVTPVYNSPSLAIGGGVIFDLPEIPKEVEVFNLEYDDELELTEEDMLNLPGKMSEDEWNALLTKIDNMKIKKEKSDAI